MISSLSARVRTITIDELLPSEAVLLKDEIHELDQAIRQWTLGQETAFITPAI